MKSSKFTPAYLNLVLRQVQEISDDWSDGDEQTITAFLQGRGILGSDSINYLTSVTDPIAEIVFRRSQQEVPS